MNMYDYFLQSAAVCHGGAARCSNEDNLYYNGGFLGLNHADMASTGSRTWVAVREGWLAGVFDGMGGYSHGEIASYLAASATKQNAPRLNELQSNVPSVLKDICLQANDAVCRQMENSGCKMGTTASLLFFREGVAWVCNIGDSPVYCFRQGRLIPLYEEHTERATYEQLKGETAEMNRKFPLTQHIGIFQDEMVIEPYISRSPLRDGDIYLICTDGLTDMVDKSRIGQILGNRQSSGEIAERLKEEALLNGGRDNITIIVVRVFRRGK